jgi:biotin carboxyl carrier protein
MPGTILEVKVTPGQSVKFGDILVVLEAMKMENEIVAPQDGTVDAILTAKGVQVNADDPLVSLI